MSATITSAGLTGGAGDFTTGYEQWSSAFLALKLFANDFFPDVNSTSPSLFTEATFGGYAAYDVSAINNGAPSYSSGVGSTQLQSGPMPFTCTSSPQTIYGYYVVDTTTNLVWAAERFATPQNLVIGGTLTLIVTAQVTQGP